MALPIYLFTTLWWIQLIFAVMLIFVCGLAWCFIFWILPIVKLNSCLSAIDQFSEISRRAGKSLDPGTAATAISLALMALLQTQHAEPAKAANWKFLAAASFTLFQVAWWEQVTIFWLDKAAITLKEERRSLKEKDIDMMSQPTRAELHRICDQWALRHALRATIPLAAALMLLMPMVK